LTRRGGGEYGGAVMQNSRRVVGEEEKKETGNKARFPKRGWIGVIGKGTGKGGVETWTPIG